MGACGSCGKVLGERVMTIEVCAECCQGYDDLCNLISEAMEDVEATCVECKPTMALYDLGRIIGAFRAIKKSPG